MCDPLFTVPVPPPTVAHDGFTARLLAATDDGHLLLQRAVTINAISFPDAIVSLTADGFPAWTFATDATQVAAAGDIVFTTTGTNQATKAIVALDGLTGAVKMTADAPDVRLDGPLIVAGGLIYVEGSDPSGTKVDIFPTDCAQPTCSRLRALDTGPAQDGFSGMSESEATLFVAKAGPDGLQAFALTG